MLFHSGVREGRLRICVQRPARGDRVTHKWAPVTFSPVPAENPECTAASDSLTVDQLGPNFILKGSASLGFGTTRQTYCEDETRTQVHPSCTSRRDSRPSSGTRTLADSQLLPKDLFIVGCHRMHTVTPRGFKVYLCSWT